MGQYESSREQVVKATEGNVSVCVPGGMITLAGSRRYTSMADTDEVIDDALQSFERVLANVEGV